MVATRFARPLALALALAVAGALPIRAGVGSAAAATGALEARVSQNQVGEDDTFDLMLSATGDEPSSPPALDALQKDFEILGTRESRRLSVINGHSESSHDWIVTLHARHAGSLEIPAMHAGDLTSAPIAIQVSSAGATAGAGGFGSGASGNATSGGNALAGGAIGNGTTAAGHAANPGTFAGGSGPAPDLLVEAEVDQSAPYVQGEVHYTVRIYDGVGLREGQLSAPHADNARIAPQGDGRNYEATVRGRHYAVHERDFTVTPQVSGPLTIPPVTLEARVPEPRRNGRRRGFDPFGDDDDFADAFADMPFGGDLFDRVFARGKEVRLHSNPVTLDVQARPGDAKGDWFLPARRVELSESWKPAKPTFRVGEVATRTIVLRALGNSSEQLPRFDIPAPDGVRQYPEGSRDASQPSPDGTIAVLEQTVSLVPTRAGKVTLPPIEVHWFDIDAKKTRSATIDAETIDVLPAAGTETADTQTSGAAKAAPGASAAAPSGATAKVAANNPTSSTSTVDADPPTAAARLLSGATVLGAVAAALLLAAGAWLTLRRRAAAAAPPTLGPSAGVAARRPIDALRTACDTGDSRAAREALLAWARAEGPTAPPRSPVEVAERLRHDGLKRAAATLEAHLFGRASGAWAGHELWRELRAAKKGMPAERANATDPVPALYPNQPPRAA